MVNLYLRWGGLEGGDAPSSAGTSYQATGSPLPAVWMWQNGPFKKLRKRRVSLKKAKKQTMAASAKAARCSSLCFPWNNLETSGNKLHWDRAEWQASHTTCSLAQLPGHWFRCGISAVFAWQSFDIWDWRICTFRSQNYFVSSNFCAFVSLMAVWGNWYYHNEARNKRHKHGSVCVSVISSNSKALSSSHNKPQYCCKMLGSTVQNSCTSWDEDLGFSCSFRHFVEDLCH